jgi:hypothetical protein
MKEAEKPATPPRPASRSAPAQGVATRPAGASTAAAASRESRQGVAGTARAGLASDLADAGKRIASDAVFGKRPYVKMALLNPYNLSLLGGGLAASVLTMNPLLALATLGLEALWLLHAPDSRRLRHLLWDPRFDRLRRSIEAAERAERLKQLAAGPRARVETLVARREEIQRLAAQNPSFTGELLRGELVKTDRLVNAFMDMALTCARYESYLDSVDLGQLERDRQRYARSAEQEGPPGEIARKNLAVVDKRVDKVDEIRRYLVVARGQLDLIENSFQLIADQIVTMHSPQELSGQLDELLDGVEAIRETTRDTEALLAAVERGE